MIALGFLLQGIAAVLHILINFFYFLIIGRCILSFVSPDPRNPIVQFIYSSTEPALAKIRGYMPQVGMLDLSPIAILALIYFLDIFLVNSLNRYGQIMQISAGAI
ncbi:MAG: YggT family protein [Proteobacteria bacterium]|nr:YggT family protein [Pseudomonadota bacterium]